MRVIVTGSNGLIGSEACAYFHERGGTILGVDNNMRAVFFGPHGDTRWNQHRLQAQLARFRHLELDIRDRGAMLRLIAEEVPDLVVHCAAQPSHDLSARIPLDDFDVNAVGTLNLLEGVRRHQPGAVFVLMSTNKVYGEVPNERPMIERATRWDYAHPEDAEGIDEHCRVDRTLHSPFGASKLAADVIAQEYGRYFGLKVGIFRGGCLTGPQHNGVELHGFLSYLVRAAVCDIPYRVYGYRGKQVRDNIHCRDVLHAVHRFSEAPRAGEVYNIGGGRRNSCSILEAATLVERLGGGRLAMEPVETPRRGDHVCYISDTRKFQAHFPGWRPEIPLESMLTELIEAWRARRATHPLT
jgi:CDP-paratose 2-epimerase